MQALDPSVKTVDSTIADQPGVARARQTRGQTRAFYDRLSSVYDLLSERSEAPVRREAVERLALQPGERVLEIGCGTGPCLPRLARAVGPGGRVVGVDLSQGMLRQAERRLRRAGLADRVDLRRADACHLPFASGTFDAVLMTFTLELFDTPEIPDVLAECRRVSHRDGHIVVAGVTKSGAGEPLVRVFEWVHAHFPAVMDCRPIFVARALRAAGLVSIDVTRMHCWVPVEIVSAVVAR